MRVGGEQVGPQIGDARFYTYVGGELSFERWLAGVKSGHTFVTTGPMLDFQVNGQRAGSSIDVKRGARLQITAKGYGHPTQIPLQRIQIVGHGKVLREARAGEAGQTSGELSIDFDLVPQHGLWIAARVDAGPAQVAHTTPVYVTVDGDGFHNRETLASHIELTKGHLEELRQLLIPRAVRTDGNGVRSTPEPWRIPGASTALERRIAETERKLEELRGRK